MRSGSVSGMSLSFIGRATASAVMAATLIVGFAAAPARAAAPVVDVFCESIGHFHVLCDVTITGGTAPFTIQWFYNGTYFPGYDNRTFTGWGCTTSGPNSYKAVVTDATGLSGTDSSGTLCRSGNP